MELSGPFCQVRTLWEVCNPEGSSLNHAVHIDLRLPTSTAVRSKCLYKSSHPWDVLIACSYSIPNGHASSQSQLGGLLSPSLSITRILKKKKKKWLISLAVSFLLLSLNRDSLFLAPGNCKTFLLAPLPCRSQGAFCLLWAFPFHWEPDFPFPQLSSSLFSAAQMQHYQKVRKSEDNY